jgi:hypothetical protein
MPHHKYLPMAWFNQEIDHLSHAITTMRPLFEPGPTFGIGQCRHRLNLDNSSDH